MQETFSQTPEYKAENAIEISGNVLLSFIALGYVPVLFLCVCKTVLYSVVSFRKALD